MKLQTIFLLVFTFIFIACNNDNKPSDLKLGEIELSVTGSSEAIPYFNKGLLLLHSFEYFDARKAFQKAQEIDNNFGMAYWGELMSYNHSLWQRQMTDEAELVLEKMGPDSESRMSLFKTELEKDLFKSIETLYGEGTKYERDIAYRDYMERLNEKYPNNHEISAFYAISILGSSRNGRDGKLYDKCAKIAQGILEENKQHPGALHYLIHAYDDPDHAHLAHDAANNYSKIAPDATHALHMPSHIYVALGHWNDVVVSNIASWNASIKKKLGKEGIEGSYHALNWLQYGLLQRGETSLAQELMDDMQRYYQLNPTKQAKSYLLAMKGAQIVESNQWTNLDSLIENLETKDLNILKQGEQYFLKGMHAYYENNISSLQSIIEEFDKDIYAASLNVGDKGFAMCSTGGFASKPPNQLDIDMVSIMLSELQATALFMEDKHDEALNILAAAVKLDEGLNYAFGPPIILKPVQEMYAEALFKLGKYDEALVAYEASLNRHPRRLLSLNGQLACLKALNKTTKVDLLTKELQEMTSIKKRKTILKA